MNDLFAELRARAQGQIAAEAEAKAIAKRKREARSPSELAAANVDAVLLAARIEWSPEAIVCRRTFYVCACGTQSWGLHEICRRDRNRREPTASRLVAVRLDYPSTLPRETLIDRSTVAICATCLPNWLESQNV